VGLRLNATLRQGWKAGQQKSARWRRPDVFKARNCERVKRGAESWCCAVEVSRVANVPDWTPRLHVFTMVTFQPFHTIFNIMSQSLNIHYLELHPHLHVLIINSLRDGAQHYLISKITAPQIISLQVLQSNGLVDETSSSHIVFPHQLPNSRWLVQI
jgi:hypothetical protein